MTARLRGCVTLNLIRVLVRDGYVPNFLPHSLQSVPRPQRAWAMTRKKYRRGRPFELAPDANRTTRFTCSAACRKRSYRGRQDRARQVYAKGETFNQIAR